MIAVEKHFRKITIEPYRPSNGTEGECFIANWCGNCERDKCQNGTKAMDDCAQDDFCEILGATFWLNVDDPDYPKEWVRENGEPKCLAFVELGQPVTVVDTQTLDLFEGQP
jgi:hypothetical protein